MYAGAHEAHKKKRRKKKRSYLLPVFLFLLGIVLCIILAIAAVNMIFDYLRQNSGTLSSPSRPVESHSGVDALGKDTTPPRLTGVKDIFVYQGDAVAYRKGVTATDNADPSCQLDVDSSRVNLTLPGTYEVIYTATDAAGNIATEKATVTVLAKQAGFVDIQTINEAADDILADIIQPGASTRQQVKAVYAWARTTIGYAGHSDRTDWRQTAYTVIRDRQGDCYGYFAVCKLLFERLGISNIDVVKVKSDTADSDHFWSLVSIDGGENYYHFDATPRVGDGDYFCLVTDAFLDAYSQTHKNSHHRDKSLYPATPTEDLP